MRRGEIFWGTLLVILGVLFYLKAAGILTGDVFSWFWPFVIIGFGVWILLGSGFSRNYENAVKFSVAMDAAAKSAKLSIDHGAGRIDLRAGANAGDFLTGTAGTAMNHSSKLNGDTLEVELEAGPSFIPFLGPEGGIWEYRLNPDLPTALVINAGASRLDIDLSDLRVTQFAFEGGASSLDLTLPTHVENSLIDIEAGASSIELHVPQAVALRFRTKSVGSLNIDENRFVRREGGIYQSVDYDTAKYRADVTINGGATSIKVV